ncbi:hypothetical protein [Actinospica robiniae]|uniref:hypothetical protein n=1 Tax=Actinospica robiniae TaxID=304901 RepID=UPI0012F817EC|nr:hypothetical protein [Actinospica robiniae]
MAVFFLGDPTNHGSNVGAVALFALGIFVLIGLLVFLITRRGRRPLRTASARARPVPESRGRSEEQPQEQDAATDAKAQ